MRGLPEGQVRVGLAGDVQPVGLVEHGRVAVGRADGQRDEQAGRQRAVGQRDGRRAEAVVQLQRALEAQQFLHRAAQQFGLLLQALQLVGVAQQRVQAVADQVGGGLVAGVEQEDAVVQQLVLAELTLVVAAQQPGQHVGVGVAGPPAALGHQRAQKVPGSR